MKQKNCPIYTKQRLTFTLGFALVSPINAAESLKIGVFQSFLAWSVKFAAELNCYKKLRFSR
jgi:hypothetical protein